MTTDDRHYWEPPRAPLSDEPPKPPPGAAPAVWPWFLAYCVIMILIYLGCLIAGVGLVVFPEFLAVELEEDSLALRVQGVVLIVIGLPFVILYSLALVLPRRKWVWVYDLVLIALGMTSLCCLPFALPLLIVWVLSDTRAAFGWS